MTDQDAAPTGRHRAQARADSIVDGWLISMTLKANPTDPIPRDWGRLKELIAAALAAAEAPARPAAEEDVCIWAEEDSDSTCWNTSCGEAFCFIDDGPAENKVKFCCYCGKPVKAVPYLEQIEQEGDDERA